MLLPYSAIGPNGFSEMGAHPGRYPHRVLRQLLPGVAGQSGSKRFEMGRRDTILADVPQGLGHQAAGPSGQGERPAAIAAKDDVQATELNGCGCPVGVIDHQH